MKCRLTKRIQRRRRSLGLEALEQRQLNAGLTADFDPRTRTLTIVGTEQSDSVSIVQSDAANRLTIQLASSGQPAREMRYASRSVERVVVRLAGAEDRFQYQTAGDVWNRKSLEVGLGSGDDIAKFGWAEDRGRSFANLAIQVSGEGGSDAVGIRLGAISDRIAVDIFADLGAGEDGLVAQVLNPTSRGSIAIKALGGEGNDELQYFGTGRLGPNSRSDVTLSGGAGNDSLEYRHDGAIDGAMSQLLEGGEGEDQIQSSVNGSASIGRLMTALRGDAGDDTLISDIRTTWFTPRALRASIDGGAGEDTAYAAAVAKTLNIENVQPVTPQVAQPPQEPFYPTLPTSIIRDNARTIEYWTRGASQDPFAPVVVLIAGGGASIDTWLPIANRLDRVGLVIAVNKPGYGRTSSVPASARSYAEAVIADIRSVVAKLAPGRQVILAGSSIGGAYANGFARRYPSEVAGVVFIDATLPVRVDPAEVESAVITPTLSVYPAGVQAEYRSIADSINAPLNAPAFPHVPVIALTQSLSGQELGQVQALADLGTPGQLQVVEDAGHFLHADQPGRVVDAIRSMVRQSGFAGILADVAARYGVPGLSASVILGQQSVSAVAGVRAAGATPRVQESDRFGMGSVTKAMTATLAGVLIDQGRIRWDSTIGELFPEYRSAIRVEYLSVTLEQLLQHRGGIIADEDASESLQQKIQAYTGPASRERFEMLPEILKEPLPNPVGTYRYSNGGYAIAGAMLERAMNRTYESLMQQYVFNRLGITSATFRPGVSDPRNPLQPIGHLEDGTPAPGDRSPIDFLSNLLSPAGSTLRMNVLDWTKFVRIHLGQRVNGIQLVSPATLERLQRGVPLEGSDLSVGYATGWLVLPPGTQGLDRRLGRVLSHNGSDGVWLSEVTAFPDINFSIQILANATLDRDGKDLSTTAFQEIRQRLMQRFGPRMGLA